MCSYNGEPFGFKKQEMLWKDKDIVVKKKKSQVQSRPIYTVQLSMKQRTVFKETHELLRFRNMLRAVA